MDSKNSDDDWRVICEKDDLAESELKEFYVSEVSILLVRLSDRIFACQGICPHMDEPLSHGFIDGTLLTCSKHLWQWNLETGAPVGLAEMELSVLPVKVDATRVLVNINQLTNGGGACTQEF